METSTAYALPGCKYFHSKPTDYIIKKACEYFELTLEQIRSKTRKEDIRLPRQIIMWLYKKHTRMSLAAIGAMCGDKDHATVLHSCRAVNNAIETNYRNVRMDIKQLEDLLI